ncbi:DUF2933 domain-containing protein [Cupriavidus oxalaticus]|uniref:DUF2933 domain-containing protein n=1 Tax=Cupriavidus oxalaticus TaxID=96344 RepID=A0A375FJL5_9BURK|nr:DUF2933 domain-containing protein [Cupriavidus oxalaticus]QRQ85902.1 DUF2933 domain-containing protein [Cupriavidus oxalaticus]QRQ95772.1 DUF2933 domain-containing protein [Cupriavidus oxalaticus]WQD84437.1 DUF2933 domain-containing protein [Cupriavidus oxalaticus]SPC06659.1 conserved exported hypothetical protein [Cupriavidus oxalaticus]SPC12357.1 conserved exported hypothetical protein [Cupriavidus oxalaticus]
MQRNMKTMVAASIALLTMLAMLAAAYAVWPPVRALVLGIGPYLLLSLCPLSMWLMMKSMGAHDDQVSAMAERLPAQKPDPFRIKELTGRSEVAGHALRMRARAANEDER